jgi:glucose-1-phosphate thymidylyltransferase
MLEANRLVLEDLERSVEGELTDAKIEGRVQVAPGAVIERSIVRGPAIIGAGTRIVDSYVGPYTAIDDGVTIERSEVEHSIVLAGCVIADLDSRMEASLLGRNVKLTRSESIPRTISMIIGDRSEITLP